ncbi:MAG: GTPase HflX [Anaerolineales bacterium]|jgi:GTP-binding protein HflX|nr:GTPase HflX [Anaerolineales bacterium]
MAKKQPEPTLPPRERAFMVGVEIRSDSHLLNLDESLAELRLLSETAGLDIVGEITQRLDTPNVQTFIGPGKIEEVRALVEETQADVILFDEELSPRHQRELERVFGEKVRILDRTALILDIFAQHAHTNEGALQVELAQYEYLLPRLTRAWTHLARQAGGGGGRAGSVGGVGLRGPGETQLEVDRRDIRRRVAHIKDQLEKVRVHRQQYRARRKRSRIPVVALVGYTNAGKSTLLNRLANADVYVADQLFATLDPTTRRVELPGGHLALFTDTVGFIQKLPTTLVAAFRATLEEIAEADLLLHLVDITHPQAAAQAKAVHQTLQEIDAGDIPILTIINKIDRLTNPEGARLALESFPNSVAISALKGTGLPDMLDKINEYLYENYAAVTVMLPYQEGALIAMFHEQGQITFEEHQPGGVLIQGRLPGRLLAYFRAYEKKPGAAAPVNEPEPPE